MLDSANDTAALATGSVSPGTPLAGRGVGDRDESGGSLLITSTTVTGRLVTVECVYAGFTHYLDVLIDVERDRRGPFDYAWYQGDDLDDSAAIERLESTALAAYQRDQEECRLPRFVACGEVRA